MIAVLTVLALSGVPGPSPQDPPPPLREQIGAMIMVGFRGLSVAPGDPVAQDLAAGRVGGVVLFSVDVPTRSRVRNIQSPDQVRRLVGQVRGAAQGRPVFVALDQEGGRVRRLGAAFGLGDSPSAHQLGIADDPDETARQALRTAQVLASLGIDVNFAPVVDLAVNPSGPAIGAHGRAYGRGVDTVVRHARRVVEAHRTMGVLTALKHFPGHGSARDDSHHGLADVTGVWTEAELGPFRALIASGHADGVMTAHLYHRRLDPRWPATLSPVILRGQLRDGLGFDGLVFSDDLQMKALADHFNFDEILRQAVAAGVDVLVFANNSIYEPEVARRVVDSIARQVMAGNIPRADIERSYRRIRAAQARPRPEVSTQ